MYSVLKLCSGSIVILYYILYRQFPVSPAETGPLTSLLGERSFLQIYIGLWAVVMIYELWILIRLRKTGRYQLSFSLFLPALFFHLYQYQPPFLLLSRAACAAVILLKLADLWCWYRKRDGTSKQGGIQIILETIILLQVSLDFFFVRSWAV